MMYSTADQTTGVITIHEGEQTTVMDEKQQLEAFCKKHKARCDEWMAHHPPGYTFPIVKRAGELHWMNRAERRQLMKAVKVVKK